jgi:hypothetical protein
MGAQHGGAAVGGMGLTSAAAAGGVVNGQQSAIPAEDIDHSSLEAKVAGIPLEAVVEERKSLTAMFSPRPVKKLGKKVSNNSVKKRTKSTKKVRDRTSTRSTTVQSEASPSGVDVKECLNYDYPHLIECFNGIVKESFPQVTTDEGAQLLYFMEEVCSVSAMHVFTKQLRDQLEKKREIWLVLDSGANQHVIKDIEIMKNKKQTIAKVIGVSGSPTTLDCQGDVELQLIDSEGLQQTLKLKGAFGMKVCPFNLVSVSKLIEEKYWLNLNGKTGELFLELPNSTTRIPIVKKDGLLMLKPDQDSFGLELGGADHIHNAFGATVTEVNDKANVQGSIMFNSKDYGMTAPLKVWHQRNRHIPMQTLRQIHVHSTHILQKRLDHHKKHVADSGGREDAEEAVTEPMSDRQVNSLEPMIHGFFKPQDDKSLKHPNCDVCRQVKLRKKPQKHHSLYQDDELKQGKIF